MNGMRAIWDRLQQRAANEEGVTASVAALSMVVMLGFTSVALDGGVLFQQRRNLQNIADAAALAGSHELPANPGRAISTAREYVLTNGGKAEDIKDISVQRVFNDKDALQVKLSRDVSLSLAGLVGHPTQEVAAKAMGLVTPIEPYKLWPWGVTEESLVKGPEIGLKVGSRNSSVGNFMALDYPASGGASDYLDYIKQGFSGDVPGPVPPGTWNLDTETGNMAGPTQTGVDYLMGQPACKSPWNDVRCPRIGLVPILEANTWDEVKGKSNVKIVGFATFLLTGITDGPTGQKEVTGKFLDYAFGVGRKTWPGQKLEGILGVRLWQ